jgi:hypothetical protein
MGEYEGHAALRRRLEAAVRGAGTSDLGVRAAAFAGDLSALGPPYRTLVERVREESSRVTDADVSAVRAAAGGDSAAFEVILAAASGAGAQRWDAAVRAIAEAGDAPG